MHLLALDIASTTGFARHGPTMLRPDCGSEKFSGPLGRRAHEFETWLEDNLALFRGGDYAAVGPITALAIEAPISTSGLTNLDTQMWLLGAHVIARKLAHQHQLKLAIVGVGTWRSFFIGRASAPKELEKNERRKWLKRAVIEECAKRGNNPKDDNAADALGLLEYCRACLDPRSGMSPDDLFAEAA